MTSYWRLKAAPIIARVLEETKGQPPAAERAALRAAYPFGVRRHHPYRIWLDEIRVQTGRREITLRVRRQQGRPEVQDEGREPLFDFDPPKTGHYCSICGQDPCESPVGCRGIARREAEGG